MGELRCRRRRGDVQRGLERGRLALPLRHDTDRDAGRAAGDYDRVAQRTDEKIATLPDLDHSFPLPEAPWFEPGASWSARRVLLHVLAETSQHAGHADVIRETIDGSKTMG